MAYSSGCITIELMAEPASDSQSASEWSSAMADESGSTPNPEKDRPSTSPFPGDPKPTPQRWNLLLVEDNLPDALLVREAIRKENLPLEVHLAADGEKAIDFIENAEKNPDAPSPQLVLLDLNLPKVSGLEVLRRLRASERFKSLPVLIVSSSDAPADRAWAAELSAKYFLKPANYAEYMKLGTVLKYLLGAGAG